MPSALRASDKAHCLQKESADNATVQNAATGATKLPCSRLCERCGSPNAPARSRSCSSACCAAFVHVVLAMVSTLLADGMLLVQPPSTCRQYGSRFPGTHTNLFLVSFRLAASAGRSHLPPNRPSGFHLGVHFRHLFYDHRYLVGAHRKNLEHVNAPERRLLLRRCFTIQPISPDIRAGDWFTVFAYQLPWIALVSAMAELHDRITQTGLPR